MSVFILDGNCATFIASIMTMSVLCFFNSKKKNKADNPNMQGLLEDKSNYIQGLLEDMFERASSFFARNEQQVIRNIKTHEKVSTDAIRNSFESDHSAALEQLNKIQVKISGYQNVYLECRKNIWVLREKLTLRPEFMSSFFFAFLFCLFVLTVDSLVYPFESTQWLKNVVFYVSGSSLLFLFSVWGFYIFSIKKVRINKEPITYEFRIRTIIIMVVFTNVLLALVSLKLQITEVIAHLLFAVSVLLSMIYMIYELVKRRKCMFTRYFMLVHFIIIVLHAFVFCVLQNFYVGNTYVVSNRLVSFCSICSALLGGLIFPFFVPLLRMIFEVEWSNYKLKRAEKDLKDSVDDMIRKLE